MAPWRARPLKPSSPLRRGGSGILIHLCGGIASVSLFCWCSQHCAPRREPKAAIWEEAILIDAEGCRSVKTSPGICASGNPSPLWQIRIWHGAFAKCACVDEATTFSEVTFERSLQYFRGRGLRLTTPAHQIWQAPNEGAAVSYQKHSLTGNQQVRLPFVEAFYWQSSVPYTRTHIHSCIYTYKTHIPYMGPARACAHVRSMCFVCVYIHVCICVCVFGWIHRYFPDFVAIFNDLPLFAAKVSIIRRYFPLFAAICANSQRKKAPMIGNLTETFVNGQPTSHRKPVDHAPQPASTQATI